MKYNFDEVIERRGTDSVKWDGVENVWGRKDLLPMWVADMDFRTPPFVMDALRRRLDHEVLGYTFACEEWYTSICSWLHKRHQWDVTRDMLTFVPGIVRGQAFALQCFTKPGDKVMVMTPVYHPNFLVTERLRNCTRAGLCAAMLYQSGRQGHGNDTGVPSFFPGDRTLGTRSGLFSARFVRRALSYRF